MLGFPILILHPSFCTDWDHYRNSVFTCKMSNRVNGPANHKSLVAQLVGAPSRYLGGLGINSCPGLGFFLCPVLVTK